MAVWCLIVLVTFVSTIRVDGQPDSHGFISIDCGLAANSSYVSDDTMLTYVSDDQFIDTGVNYNVATNNRRQWQTVRSFPNGTRNCYTLRSLIVGSKYLVRATFLYGNYDNLNSLPIFDIHLGVNYWDTVNLLNAADSFINEIITTAIADYLQVCLINTHLGTPFISALHLRTLGMSIYKYPSSSKESLVMRKRCNLGASNFPFLRYPDDPYDRFWYNYTLGTWKEISTNSTVQPDTDYATPSMVMRTAATTLSTNQSLDMYWNSPSSSSTYLVIIHIREIQNTSLGLREFDVLSNGIQMFNGSVVVPDNASLGGHRSWFTTTGYTQYNMSLRPTSRSTLPPLMNAFELYIVAPFDVLPSYSGDVTAMNSIKAYYQVKKGWSGDPCVPRNLSWIGVTCTYGFTNNTRITSLNLSSSGLTGTIESSFGNLSALKSLDLSGNDLSGDLPNFLDELEALTYLDIRGNSKISTTLPPGLQKKKQNGTLTYKYGGTPTPTPSPASSPSRKIVVMVVPVVVVPLLIVLAIIIFLCLKRRKQNKTNFGTGQGKLNFDHNRQFSYNDLKRITNDFGNSIGTGGFGSVYMGVLENGTEVAVKMRSHSSSQGIKEFLAEAQNLTRVHHRNLVSLIGYCMDGEYMALVYEYMHEGTLRDKLKDDARPLTWKQRLRIAYESALGLEYLHKACNPPLIHRDVKTNNILLNVNLEAKIADFGLSRAFDNEASSHVSTVVVGTPGYLDPEYFASYQLSEKSDVFSFGVVLLEIITGQPPIIEGSEGGHVIQWVNDTLSKGDIESIVDPRMQGEYDINSVWKVTNIACKCTEHSSAHRPRMDVVVAELKESLDLENSREGTCSSGSTTTRTNLQ